MTPSYVGCERSNGSYNLSGSGLLSSLAGEFIGSGGTGTFTQSGGTNLVTLVIPAARVLSPANSLSARCSSKATLLARMDVHPERRSAFVLLAARSSASTAQVRSRSPVERISSLARRNFPYTPGLNVGGDSTRPAIRHRRLQP